MCLNFYLRKAQPVRQLSPVAQENHEKVCALLRVHGLSSDGLSPFEAQMKLAKRVAALVREHRRVR